MEKTTLSEPTISPLFITSIALTANATSDATSFRQHTDSVIARWRESGQIQTAYNGQGQRYKVHYQLVHGTDQICSIQLDPVQPGHSTFRLEYSPAQTNEKGRALLQQHLNALFLTEYGEVMRNAKLINLELAVDIAHVNFANLLVTEKRKRTSSVYGEYMDQGGQIERFHLGAPRSDGQMRIIDMANQQTKAEGKNAGALAMRVEATLIPRVTVPKPLADDANNKAERRKQDTAEAKAKLRSGIYLHELDRLRNPFERVQLFSLPAAAKLRDDYRWQIFLRCCERIGAQAALALLPDKKRQAYLKRFAQGAFHWWNPNKIWDGLRPAFDDLELFPESAFVKTRSQIGHSDLALPRK